MSPEHRFIQKSDHPRNDGGIGNVEHVPFEAEGVEGEEVRNRAIKNAVDGVADGPADDETDAGGESGEVMRASQTISANAEAKAKRIRAQRPSSLCCGNSP